MFARPLYTLRRHAFQLSCVRSSSCFGMFYESRNKTVFVVYFFLFAGSVKTSLMTGSSFNITWHLAYPHRVSVEYYNYAHTRVGDIRGDRDLISHRARNASAAKRVRARRKRARLYRCVVQFAARGFPDDNFINRRHYHRT